jgi:hypothetical protein
MFLYNTNIQKLNKKTKKITHKNMGNFKCIYGINYRTFGL